jgi:hypothetical protein
MQSLAQAKEAKGKFVERTPARRVFDVSLPLIAAVIVITACLMQC